LEFPNVQGFPANLAKKDSIGNLVALEFLTGNRQENLIFWCITPLVFLATNQKKKTDEILSKNMFLSTIKNTNEI
jgi:hypothetical protein